MTRGVQVYLIHTTELGQLWTWQLQAGSPQVRVPGMERAAPQALNGFVPCRAGAYGKAAREGKGWACSVRTRIILARAGISSQDVLQKQQQQQQQQQGDGTNEQEMLKALRQERTEDAWKMYQSLRKSSRGYPSRVCVSRLVAQLCHQGGAASISRAQGIVAELCRPFAAPSSLSPQEEQKQQQDQQKQQQDQLLVDWDALGLLVVATAKSGAARYALELLRFMLRCCQRPPAVRVWSAVVSRLSRGDAEEAAMALQLFDEVCGRLAGAYPHEDMPQDMPGLESLLRVPPESRAALPDCAAFNAALNACAGSNRLRTAALLRQAMGKLGVQPSVITFNIAVKLYAREGRADLLDGVVAEMEAAGVSPNEASFSSFIAAYVGLGQLQRAEAVLRGLGAKVLAGSISDSTSASISASATSASNSNSASTSASNSASTSASNSASTSASNSASDSAPEWAVRYRGTIQADVRMYTTLMKGYVQQGRVADAMQLLVRMREEGSSSSDSSNSAPNEVTFTTIIRALSRTGLLPEARAILAEMAAAGVAANAVTYNTLLAGAAAIPDMATAAKLAEEMAAAGVAADVVTFNTLIAGHVSAGDNAAALDAFRRMRDGHVAPTRATYGTLMKAFASTQQPTLAASVFREMQGDPHVRVDTVAWNTLVDAYARAGSDVEARGVLEEMRAAGVAATCATYGTLAKAFARSRNYGELLLLWREIGRRASSGDLRPDEALLDTLIDGFVRGGYFRKALKVVECMEQQGIADGRAKAKYKRLYVELYADLYTSPYRSQGKRLRTAGRRRAVEAFKFWVGLPNRLYATDWRLALDDAEEEDEQTFRER